MKELNAEKIAEQIKALVDENKQLKAKNAQYEKMLSKPEPEHHICDLMPIGETFCGLEVVEHDNTDGMSVNVKLGDRTEWMWDSTARAIYDSEMELRELRRMKPVVRAARNFYYDPNATTRLSLDMACREYKSELKQP